MKLSDVMSAMRLEAYAEVGLVLFLLAFLVVALDLLLRGKSLESARLIPLEPEGRAEGSREETRS